MLSFWEATNNSKTTNDGTQAMVLEHLWIVDPDDCALVTTEEKWLILKILQKTCLWTIFDWSVENSSNSKGKRLMVLFNTWWRFSLLEDSSKRKCLSTCFYMYFEIVSFHEIDVRLHLREVNYSPEPERSSRRVSRSRGGGGWKTLKNRITYSELTWAESRERSSSLAESSRVT